MEILNLRDAGPQLADEIEVFCDKVEVERHGNFSRFETSACAVAYGDNYQPSHSVRIFKFMED